MKPSNIFPDMIPARIPDAGGSASEDDSDNAPLAEHPRPGIHAGTTRPVTCSAPDGGPDDQSIAAIGGHSTNLVGIPTWLLINPKYNDTPTELHINGVQEMNRSFFRALHRSASPEDAALNFDTYMNLMFGQDPEQRREKRKDGKREYRSSFHRLLKGWMFDSNSPEGAVMKGWVESRFGILPTFHREPLKRFASEAWMTYLQEKMNARFHNNSISSQLDLLYEYCQWRTRRFGCGCSGESEQHLTLYRGMNSLAEHQIVEKIDKHRVELRLNSIVSFSSERDIAEEFGDLILEVKMPKSKILFYQDLLPHYPFRGEGEFLALGGVFQARMSYY